MVGRKKWGAVQETLPQGREKPVAGLQPVSRQRMERILPSEKEEGSSVETKTTEHILTSLKAVSCLPKPVKSRKENANGSKTHERKDCSDNTLLCCKPTYKPRKGKSFHI